MLRPSHEKIAHLMDFPLVADRLPHRCPVRAAYRLVGVLEVQGKQLAQSGLSLRRTCRQTAGLGEAESERVYRVAEAWLMAMRVFSDAGKARQILLRPHALLAGRVPFEAVAADESNLLALEQLLGRLHFGTAA